MVIGVAAARRICVAVIGLGALLPFAPAVGQEDYVGRANALYATIADADRSDKVLLPVLAAMTPPPGVVSLPRQAMLFPAGAPGWDAVVEWCQAPAQQAALDALATITQDKDVRRGMAFGQPYGQAAGYEALSTGLYTDLGDPPLLAAADFTYLPALDQLACLVHAEATRRASEGAPQDAVRLMVDWLFFARQMAAREFFDESRWGYESMINALERIRDIVYEDMRNGDSVITAQQLKDFIEWGDQQGRGLELDKLTFPRAEQIAFEQLLAFTYVNRGGPDPDTFAPTMARLAAKDRPLQLFSAAARWEQAAGQQANYFEMRDEGAGCFADWAEHRWRRDWHDPFLKEPSHFETLDPEKFAMLGVLCTRATPDGMVDFTILEHQRERVLTEIVGTRTALAIAAYVKANRRFPPLISSLVPEYLAELEADPYNPNRSRGAKPPLEYFVPWTINDRTPTERDINPPPHEMNIIIGGGFNFQRRVGKDQFILYSVGPNGGNEKAQNIENSSKLNAGDYLLWPPVLSLHRQYLRDQGQFQ